MHILVSGANGDGYGAILGFSPEDEFTGPFSSDPRIADPQPSVPLPSGVTWRPLIGNPLVRRTWAAWPASSRRRGLSALIAALDVTMR